eukprot:3395087-Prymnesium_polylepis.1
MRRLPSPDPALHELGPAASNPIKPHPLDSEECGGDKQPYSEERDEVGGREAVGGVEKWREDEPQQRVGEPTDDGDHVAKGRDSGRHTEDDEHEDESC